MKVVTHTLLFCAFAMGNWASPCFAQDNMTAQIETTPPAQEGPLPADQTKPITLNPQASLPVMSAPAAPTANPAPPTTAGQPSNVPPAPLQQPRSAPVMQAPTQVMQPNPPR